MIGHLDQYYSDQGLLLSKFEIDWTYNNLKVIDEWTPKDFWGLIKTEDWKFKKSNWNRFTYIDFVLMDDWRLIFWEKHSVLSGWKNVKMAWWIKVSQNSWIIQSWNISSGHYRPRLNDEVWIETFRLKFLETFSTNLNDYEFTWIIRK